MAANHSVVKEKASTDELLAMNEALREELERAQQTIKELQKQSAYYRQVALAISRRNVDAETLAVWLREPANEKHVALNDLMAELEKIAKP